MSDQNPTTSIKIPRTSFEDASNKRESRVFVGAPDFRVFIWGVEVTSDVFSVSTTLAMNDEISTAMINIVNDNEKWVLPTQLAASNIDAIPDELSEQLSSDVGPMQAGDSPLGLSLGTNTKDPSRRYMTPNKFARFKRQNMLKKLQAESAAGKTVANLVIDKIQSSNLFPFLPGRPLIQMADPIRIFLKNPWKFDGEEEWYFAFTGFIAAVTEDFDAETNRSILRCSCEDIRRLMRYMRTSTNPNVFDMNVLQNDSVLVTGSDLESKLQGKIGNVSADLVLNTGNAAVQAGMVIARRNDGDPPGIMELLLLGDTSQLAIQGGNSGDASPFVSGVLGFNPNNKQVVTLQLDQLEKTLSPTLDLIYPILAPADVTRFGLDWSLGDFHVNSSAEPNTFWVILPDDAHFPGLRDPFRWDMRIDFFSEFRSRLDIINEFVNNIDCIWYATPKGDVVLEFPDYDALPQLHGDPWKSVLTLQNEFARFSSTEDDRNIKTLTIASGSAVDGIDTSSDAPFLAYFPFKNPELIARYGVREQRANRPFHYKNQTIGDALPALSAMWQELANSDAYRLEGLEMLPSFRAAPGRPYLFKFRNVIGFAMQVTHQVVWNELAQTIYGLKYLRHFDARQGDWQKISGNYGWRWKPSETNPASGVLDDRASGAKFARSTSATGDIGDPTSVSLDQQHQAIRTYEAQNGMAILTPEQHDRLDTIAQQFATQSLPSDQRAVLLDEFNGIIGSQGGRN